MPDNANARKGTKPKSRDVRYLVAIEVERT